MALVLSKQDPLFRAELKQAPGLPAGERVLLVPKPTRKTSDGGIIAPDVARERMFAGTILAAGDQAADKLYDIDYRIGDEVYYGKYAGVIEEWQRLLTDGDAGCRHDGAWDNVAKGHALDEKSRDKRWDLVKDPDDDMTLHACRTCGALRLTQRLVAMVVEDIVFNVDAQVRRERGIVKRKRDYGANGETRYVLIREPGFVDGYESPGVRGLGKNPHMPPEYESNLRAYMDPNRREQV